MAIVFIDGQALSATQLNAALAGKLDTTADASNLTAVAGLGTTARSMANRFSDVINVLDFLTAVPDGATDNTTQLQAAINDAGGARVYFPRTTQPYSVSGLTIPANSHLTIDGTILLRSSSTNSVLRIINSSSNVTIDGTGIVDGNKANQSAAKHGIEATIASDVLISSITVQNAFLSPLNLATVTTLVIDDCILQSSNKAVTLANACTNAWLRNSVISSIADHGVMVYGGVSNSWVTGCSITGATNGITVWHDTAISAACHDLKLEDNVVFANTAWGILVDKGTGAVGNHSNIQINHNRVYGNNTSNTAATGGIKNNTATNVQIVGNLISKNGNGANGAQGIAIAASNTEAISNQIVNEGQGSVVGVGINLANTANNVLLASNQVIDDQTTKTCKFAFSGAAGTNVRILNNSANGMITNVNNVTMAADSVSIDSSSNVTTVNGPFATTGASCDQSIATVVPVTGFATTIGNGASTYLMVPAGTLASGTLTMPAVPIIGQMLRIITTQTITAFTLNANTGQSILGAPSAAAFNANTSLTFIFSGTTWYRLSDSVGGTATTGPLAVRTVTAAGAITVLNTDDVVIVNKTVGAATAVTLPNAPAIGFILTIKDGKGDCATNPITITPSAGTIDGAANLVLNSNFDSVDLIYSASNVWTIY